LRDQRVDLREQPVAARIQRLRFQRGVDIQPLVSVRVSTPRNGAGIDTRPLASSRLVKLETKRSIGTERRPQHARRNTRDRPATGPPVPAARQPSPTNATTGCAIAPAFRYSLLETG